MDFVKFEPKKTCHLIYIYIYIFSTDDFHVFNSSISTRLNSALLWLGPHLDRSTDSPRRSAGASLSDGRRVNRKILELFPISAFRVFSSLVFFVLHSFKSKQFLKKVAWYFKMPVFFQNSNPQWCFYHQIILGLNKKTPPQGCLTQQLPSQPNSWVTSSASGSAEVAFLTINFWGKPGVDRFQNILSIWVFPKIGIPENGWFFIKMDDLKWVIPYWGYRLLLLGINSSHL